MEGRGEVGTVESLHTGVVLLPGKEDDGDDELMAEHAVLGGLEHQVIEPLEDLGRLELVRCGRVEEHITGRACEFQVDVRHELREAGARHHESAAEKACGRR